MIRGDKNMKVAKHKNEMLGTENVKSLLFKLSMPAMIGMIVQALYNFVDTIFVGRGAGYLAIGGIAIAFPVQMVIMAFGQMFGIGGASIVSRALGAKDYDKAEKTVGNVLTSSIIAAVIMTILGLVFLEPILKLFGATENLLPYSKEYLSVILLGSISFIVGMAGNNLIRAEGNAVVSMVTMLISAGLNIILDPIFIFVFDMGIKGAAIATVISQTVSTIYILFHFLGGKSAVKLHLNNLILNAKIMKEIITVGISAFVRQVASSIMTIVLNNAIKMCGGGNVDIAISAYGIINRLMMFVLMPMFGIVQGMLPIVGFNYGAGKFKRVKKTLKYSITTVTIMSIVGFLILMIFPKQLIGIFDSSKNPELLNIGVTATRMVVLAMPVIGFQVIASSLFQALGMAMKSFVLSSSRQILILIPLILILSKAFGLIGIWAAFPVADILSAILTAIFFTRQIKRFNKEEEMKIEECY